MGNEAGDNPSQNEGGELGGMGGPSEWDSRRGSRKLPKLDDKSAKLGEVSHNVVKDRPRPPS